MLYSPIKFKPIFKERIWGSDRLKQLFGKDLPPGKAIGESWELADLPDDKSIAASGPFSGMDIRQILDEHGLAMGFTAEQIAEPFGLLIKFLDANDRLSVQVHPDAQISQTIPNARPKTECWYVLDAQPGSVIYRGLKPGISRGDLVKAIDDNKVEQLMEVYPARTGDFHFLPAGTIHALGAGIMVAEIQTPSDTTYRLYDWDRHDSCGQGRQLHIDQALACINFTDSPPTADNICPTNDQSANQLLDMVGDLGIAKNLINCDCFSVAHLTIDKPGSRQFEASVPFVIIVLDGRGKICNGNDPENATDYHQGDTILVPTMSSGLIEVSKQGQMLLVSLGMDN